MDSSTRIETRTSDRHYNGIFRGDDSFAFQHEFLKPTWRGKLENLFQDELFNGLTSRSFPKLVLQDINPKEEKLVVLDNIDLTCTCNNPFGLIDGTARIAYVARHKTIDETNIKLLMEFFSQQPQSQKVLTERIKASLHGLLETSDVEVIIDAELFCIKQPESDESRLSKISHSVAGVFQARSTHLVKFNG